MIYVKDIYQDLNISKPHIKKILQEADIKIVNYAKRVTPKGAFKKGQKAHNKGLTLEEQYGERSKDIKEKKEKIGARIRGKTHQ
jgi:hypothetical protein